MRDLPKYKCNKVVEAFKIKEVKKNLGAKYIVLKPEQDDINPVTTNLDYLNKHNPKAGGYYVIYKDGYQSFSPAEAFEEGYTLIEDDGVIYTTDKTPDLTGVCGTAWLVMKEFDTRPDVQAAIDSWVVKAAYAHPFWTHYMVNCISLRDIPDVPDAKKVFPEATHEISIVALNPDKPYPLNTAPNMLMPINYAGQWVALNDEDARATAVACVLKIITGTLSPDTDFRSEWDKMFKSK